METGWKLEELAEQVGVSPRTVRYYVQRGLLPAPVFRGRDTVYGDEHRVRLLAIRALQERFLPLDAIQSELEGRTLDEVRAIAEGEGGGAGGAGVGPRGTPAAREEEGLERWARWVLAPGLELHLSEGADARTRALAENLKAMARGRGRGGTT